MNLELQKTFQLQPLTASLSDLQGKCSFQQDSPRKKHPRIAEINSGDRPGISALNKPDKRKREELRIKSRVIIDRTKYIEQWLQTHKNVQKNNLTSSNNSSPSSVSSSIVYESPPQLIQSSKKNNLRSPLKDCNHLKRFKSNESEKVNAQIRLNYSPVKNKAKENQQVNNKLLSSPKKLSKHREKNIVDQYEENLHIESCLSPINVNPADDSPLEIMELNSPAPSSLFVESVHSDCNSPQVEEIQSLLSPRITHECINIDESDTSVVCDENLPNLDLTILSDSDKTISDLVGNLDRSLVDIDEIQSEHSRGSLNHTIDSDETFFSEIENANCTVVASKIDDDDDDCDGKSGEDERYKKVVIDDDDDDDEVDRISENELVISEVTSQSVTNIDSTPREVLSIEENSDLSQRKIDENEMSAEEISHISSQKISQDYPTPPPAFQGNSTDLDNIINISDSPPSKQSSRLGRDAFVSAVVKKKKKKPKKGSLVEKLQALVSRKISSIRIWRHQMSQDHLKINSPCVTVQINECIWRYSRYIIDGRVVNDDNDLIGRCVRENSLTEDTSLRDKDVTVDGNNKNLLSSIKLLLVPEIVGKINFDGKNIIKIYPPWDIIDLNDVFINIFYFIVTVDANVINHKNVDGRMKLVKEFKCPCLSDKKLSESCDDKFKNSKTNFMQYLFQS